MNNKEYYNITKEINDYNNNFSSTFKFNATYQQVYTLSFTPNKTNINYYLIFHIHPSNLYLTINAFSDNKVIN